MVYVGVYSPETWRNFQTVANGKVGSVEVITT
jgi:hypothetical protein